jgi:hypothetical protein
LPYTDVLAQLLVEGSLSIVDAEQRLSMVNMKQGEVKRDFGIWQKEFDVWRCDVWPALQRRVLREAARRCAELNELSAIPVRTSCSGQADEQWVQRAPVEPEPVELVTGLEACQTIRDMRQVSIYLTAFVQNYEIRFLLYNTCTTYLSVPKDDLGACPNGAQR